MDTFYSVALKKEAAIYARAIRRQGKKICRTKKSAMAFLVEVGIYDKKGRLTRHYR